MFDYKALARERGRGSTKGLRKGRAETVGGLEASLGLVGGGWKIKGRLFSPQGVELSALKYER